MQRRSRVQKDGSPDPHARLTRLALIANALAWVVFIVFLITASLRWVSTQVVFDARVAQDGVGLTFADEIRNDPVYALSVGMDIASDFMQGVIFGLGLKGISLGLYMIVETDLNYRAGAEEEAAP